MIAVGNPILRRKWAGGSMTRPYRGCAAKLQFIFPH